jgi:hypothetical protein
LEIGPGAGPYYGIWTPAETLQELRLLQGDYRTETGVTVLPSQPFPFGMADAQEILRCQQSRQDESVSKEPYPSDGCIPICHQGCPYWTVLVTAGDLAGSVWDVACFEGCDGFWAPARRPTGVVELWRDGYKELPSLSDVPRFNEWYLGWIERGLVDTGG